MRFCFYTKKLTVVCTAQIITESDKKISTGYYLLMPVYTTTRQHYHSYVYQKRRRRAQLARPNTSFAQESSVRRPWRLTSLIHLNVLMVKLISLLFGGAVCIHLLRCLPISSTSGGNSPQIIKLGIVVKWSLNLFSRSSFWICSLFFHRNSVKSKQTPKACSLLATQRLRCSS